MPGSAVIKNHHIGLQRLSALAAMVRSSVGPNKQYKFIQDDTSGESALVCSCFRIIENLEPTCAVGQLVFETIQAHHKIYRSGSGCLLFLAGAWSRAALGCLQKGISVGQIISFMSEGMDVCIDVCKKSSVLLDLAVKGRHAATPHALGLQRSEGTITGAPQVSCHVQESDHKTLNTSQQRKTKLSRHFCETKSKIVPTALHLRQPDGPGVTHVAQTLSHGCDSSMKLVVEAVQMQSKTNEETVSPTFDISKVMTCVLPGLSEEHACVLQGCVVLLSHQQTSVAHQIKEKLLKVALINGDLAHTYRHLGFKKPPGVRRVREQLPSTSSSKEDEWLDMVVGVFLNLEVNLVLTTGLACEQLIQRCCARRILVVEKVSSSVLGIISGSFGAVPVTYATQLSKRCVGTGVQVFIWRDLSSYERGSATAVNVSTGRGVGLVTAVITSCIHGNLRALEDQFWACAYRLHHALKDGVLLPGAGGAETLCIHHLQKEAERHVEEGSDRVQRTKTAANIYRGDVLRLMADGFMEWITAMMVNAGRFSPVEARTAVSRQLQDFHRDQIIGGKFSQLASESEREASALSSAIKPDEALAAIIYDNLSVKLEAWRKALDLVFLVLQTDAEIITGTAHDGEEHLMLL
ncbi:Bardet-Biedl syndrome 12 protein [Nematolebias whitei]|uniref:Bardet-Biedl syndrome 12 protein n=1 Tax=Nematolebias whitei TaxID=451745 RepID=UPI00189A00FF|nr:Bardet-Biedl syndrome 12 protein [Nematolebias whitei]